MALTMVTVLAMGWLPDIIQVSIPNLQITQDLGKPWLYAFYVAALLAAYITTSTTFIFAAGKRFEKFFLFDRLKEDSFLKRKPNRQFQLVAILVAVYALLVSLLGVMTIINKGMAICGLLYLPFILIPQIFIAPFKCKKLEEREK